MLAILFYMPSSGISANPLPPTNPAPGTLTGDNASNGEEDTQDQETEDSDDETVSILPLGDSITRPNADRRGYLYPLWVKLVDAGIDFDFVGSQSAEPSDNPEWPDHNDISFDRDHEGHGGWSIEDLLDGLPTWLEDYTPDIVLLHAGTNDAAGDDGMDDAIEALKQIIDELREDNSDVITLLAKLIPSSETERNENIEALNPEMYDIAGEKNEVASPIVVVDQNTGFDASSDTHDGIHPDASGEEKLAQKWFNAISEAVAPASCLAAEGDALHPVPEGILVAAVAADDDEDNGDDEDDDSDDENDEDSNGDDNDDDEDNGDDEDNDSDGDNDGDEDDDSGDDGDNGDDDEEDDNGDHRPIHILPLGDSITQANDGHRSYRYLLWASLLDEGINVDFVGSQHSNHNGNPEWSEHDGHSFDQDHEGHWGWRADELLASLPQWLEGYAHAPDIVLLHAGTNDASRDDSTDSTVSELKQIIDVLRQANPNVVILLAKLIPAEDSDVNENIEDLNEEIDSIAGEKTTVHSPVIVVDQNDGFSADDDTYDGTHPDKSGEEKMSEKWFEAVMQAVEAHPCLSGDASVDTQQASQDASPLIGAVTADDVLAF